MSLRLVFDSPKGYRPKAGQLYLMKTTAGFIPVGITSTEAFFGNCVMIHPYRALVRDTNDASYYPLVEKNELLIPPVMIAKRDFKKGGDFTKVTDKNAPSPVPFEKYYYYLHANVWNPEELAFVLAYPPYPDDRLPKFQPMNERTIHYTIHDSNPPQGGTVDQAPEGTYFIVGQGVMMDLHLEFELEDALSYYGLIDTPRPPHADLSDDEPAYKEATTTLTPEEFLHLADLESTTSVFAAMDQVPDAVAAAITETGHEPNGYLFDGLATYLINQQGLDQKGIEFYSEAGMFSILGNTETLTTLHQLLIELLHNPSLLTATIREAEAVGFDFDD